MYGFIYKITNKVNERVYIGQTRHTVEYRWRQHIKNFNIEHRKQPLYLAMAKYGIENFVVEEIEKVDVNKLDEREMFWIAKYNSFKEGYNGTIGGQGSRIYIWTDDKYEEIRTMYLSGFTLKKIAEIYNVSSYTIRGILLNLNVKLRGNPMNMNNQEAQEVIKDYTMGVSLKEIASRYKVSRETVKEFLVNHGVNLKIKSQILKDENMQLDLINDFMNDMKWKDIEIKYHSDQRTIKTILTRHGISFKRNKTKSGRNLDSDFETEIINKYLSNENIKVKELANSLGINTTTIYNVLKRYNVNCRKYNQSTSVQSLKS